MTSREDNAIMARFAADYLSLLDQRILAIQAHLKAGNDATAHVALLSLESTSTMVGATELAGAVGALRTALERDDRQIFAKLGDAMILAASRVPAQLGHLRSYPTVEDNADGHEH